MLDESSKAIFMDANEYFKDQYFYELNRRDRMYRDLTLPFAILVALTTATVSLAGRLSLPFSDLELLICWILGGSASIICLLVITLWRSWAEHPYAYPATSDEIKRYAGDLQSFHQEGKSGEKSIAAQELNEFLVSEYIRCSSTNAMLNDRRASYVKWSKRFILVLSILVALGHTLAITGEIIAENHNLAE